MRKFTSACEDCPVRISLNSLDAGFVIVDRNGIVILMNHGGGELLGLTESKCLGKQLASLLTPELAAFWEQATHPGMRATLVISSGSRRIRGTLNDCFDGGGSLIGRVLMLRDVTDEKTVHVQLPASVVDRLMQASGAAEPQGGPSIPLTPREEEILKLLSKGFPNKAIAENLGISLNTVTSHLKHLYSKLDVRNRSQAAAFAFSRLARRRGSNA